MPVDVVIAGAGPNGLMLACELGLAGVRPVLLEARPEPGTESRANGLVGQVVRTLDMRSLLERLSGSPQPPQPSPAFVFGGLPLDLRRLADNPLFGLPVPQRRIEQVLAERAGELGAEIRRGHALVGLAQDGGAVTVEVDGPEGRYRIAARYLVGADGGRSTTRKLCGIGFPGSTSDDVVSRTAQVRVPPELLDAGSGGLAVPGHGIVPAFLHHRTDRGVFVYGPLPGRPPLVSTIEWGRHGAADEMPMTLDEMRASIARVLGADVPLLPPAGEGPHLLRRVSGGNTRIADRYRDGRVLLVGDAAHVHSAIGGPGLNLGLQDAVNLGWKLAAAVQGRAPDGLLDSYETERRPVAERVSMHTRAQMALLAPGSEVTALRALFVELLEDERTTAHIAALMSGADVRYPMGAGTSHPLVGGLAPELELDAGAGPVRLAELIRDARPLLVDFTADGDLAGEVADWEGVAAVASRSPGPATALLLRPDGYVAWATASPHPDRRERDLLRAALGRWCRPRAGVPA
jgi:2-polyprenyl-6-methoxyphenol hydroxylase-like FAD-dependent oxidoreductase